MGFSDVPAPAPLSRATENGATPFASRPTDQKTTEALGSANTSSTRGTSNNNNNNKRRLRPMELKQQQRQQKEQRKRAKCVSSSRFGSAPAPALAPASVNSLTGLAQQGEQQQAEKEEKEERSQPGVLSSPSSRGSGPGVGGTAGKDSLRRSASSPPSISCSKR